jgi:DNA-binding MarR family transcriptional regulator
MWIIMPNQTIFELLHMIEQVTHKMHVNWRQQVDYDLGVSHIVALHELQMNGESRPSELARLLNFTPASLTHLSTKLSDKELITRRQDETDRRIIYWTITKKGEELLDEAQKDGQHLRMKVFSHLTEMEQQSLLSMYTKLNKALK